MEVKKAAMAGTLESSDAQVTVEPGNGTVELSIESSVIHQFGKQIKATVLETLNRLDVKDAKVTVVDKGALDCTLKARVECAVYRSNDITENLPWGAWILPSIPREPKPPGTRMPLTSPRSSPTFSAVTVSESIHLMLTLARFATPPCFKDSTTEM